MHPDELRRSALEPFHFCAGAEATVPLGREARTLEEFRRSLDQASHASFRFHFLVSRLRLGLHTNDFAVWFAEELGLETLARLTNDIDIYTNTLGGAKTKLVSLIDRELAS
jgi:hypothetical protein